MDLTEDARASLKLIAEAIANPGTKVRDDSRSLTYEVVQIRHSLALRCTRDSGGSWAHAFFRLEDAEEDI